MSRPPGRPRRQLAMPPGQTWNIVVAHRISARKATGQRAQLQTAWYSASRPMLCTTSAAANSGPTTTSVTTTTAMSTEPRPTTRPSPRRNHQPRESRTSYASVTVLMIEANAVARENRASTSASVRVLKGVANRSRAVSMAGPALSVSSSCRKRRTESSTRRALPCPMTSDSWPRTAATTMSTGKVVRTAMKAFSPARPSTRSRSHLRTMSATSRAVRRTTPRGSGLAASAAVAAARASALRRWATSDSTDVARAVEVVVTPPWCRRSGAIRSPTRRRRP